MENNTKITLYDVIIAGGGIAGCSCAYMCAKFGLKTLLIEKASYLGGQITGGLVIPAMKTNSQNLNTDFFNDLISHCKKFDAQITYGDDNPAWFNPELLKIVLDDMLINAGCKILFDAQISEIKKENKNSPCNFFGKIYLKTLSIPFESKYIVDATGEGNLAELLNCKFWDDADQKQPNSLRFSLSGVNIDKLCDFLNEIDDNKDVTNFYKINGQTHFTTAYTWDNDKKWALTPYFERAIADNVLQLEDSDYFQLFSVASMPNTVAFNCPRLKAGLHSYSDSIINGRKSILRLHNFCKKYLPGFEDSYISNMADIVGIRELRRVKCKYDFTIEDIYNPKDFKNKVLYSDYPIDIHSNKQDGSTLKSVQTYSLPLESLISSDYDELFVIGKCLGADFKAQASLRVQKSCMSMGEGVSRHLASLFNKDC